MLSIMEGFMSKIKEEVEETSRLLWKETDPKDLEPGDHIYAHMKLGSYSHHGIYVGEGFVIHYTGSAPCLDCGYRKNTDRGVVRTSLDCFRREYNNKLHSIRRFAYGVLKLALQLKKSGTSTMLECSCRTADEAMGAAYELLRSKGFGKYDLQRNNCEHFATFCRTGLKQCEQMSFSNDVGDWFKKLSS